MREILFKGKHFKNNEWVFGVPCFMPTGAIFIIRYADDIKTVKDDGGKKCYDVMFNCFEIIPETLSQYTGLTDKHGNQIFENDILDAIDYKIRKGLVKFGLYKQADMASDYECGNQGFYVWFDVKFALRPDIYYWNINSVVVGNIFDNPELLTESN